MCIRDREKVVNSFTGKVNIPKEIEKISELDFALPKQYNQKFTMTRFFRYVFMSPEPVSYTHLDVYKRQILGCN